MLSGVDHNREIIVIGERDEKPDGKWPGRDGAVRTAKRLAEELERPIAWALPPDNAKDARGWLNVMPELPVDRLADLFVSGLETTVISPPIVIRPPKPTGPTVAVDDWRDQDAPSPAPLAPVVRACTLMPVQPERESLTSIWPSFSGRCDGGTPYEVATYLSNPRKL